MRKFQLTRYFSLLSLVFVILAGGVLGWLVRSHELGQMEYLAQNRNLSMARVFQNLLAGDIEHLMVLTAENGTQAAVVREAIDRFRLRLTPLLQHSDIVKIKVYNPQGITIFSTDLAQVGVDQSANSGFVAAREGRLASELTHRDRFSGFEGERYDIDLVSSYIPLHDEQRVYAIFELYQDVTPLLTGIERSLVQVWFIIALVLSGLYLVLLLAVRYAQSLLAVQEAELEAANRDLDRRVAERTTELRNSESRLRTVLDTARDAIITLDDSGHVVGWNPAAQQMFGYSADEILHQSIEMVFPRRLRDALMRHIDQLMRGETEMHMAGSAVLTGLRKDGTEFPFDYSRAVWEAPEGRFLTTIVRDVTERKLAETELSIAAAAFDMPEGVVVTDASTTILRVNQAFCDSTGYSAEEVVGKKPNMLRSGLHDDAFYAAMWESVHATGAWQGEIWDRRKNGEIYPKWLSISAVRDKEGGVTHYVGTHLDITERKAAEEQIKQLAYYDHLTELPNRSLLMDRLRQAMVASERSRAYGALLFLDLDHFKEINDTLGHHHGDELLQQVAAVLTDNVRQSDTVARLGGDEFVVVLSDLEISVDEAVAHVEAICRKLLLALVGAYQKAAGGFHGSGSIGVTLFRGLETSTEELLKQADLAMYKSKEAGRNTFHFFDPAMEASVLQRTRMEADLHRAVREAQFVLHYQPVVEGGSGRVVSAEALVRWMHPERGMVSPVEFIPAAEENGLILPIGQWVLETACRQLAVWAEQPVMAHLSLAVNVSAQQFLREDFVDQVKSVLGQTGAHPTRLKLELTESIFVENVEDIIAKMQQLKSLGIGFSLDDFGTGYSSLAYLSRLPLDQLKIDRSFVRELGVSDSNVTICAATISMAHSLRLKVVAEGVETELQKYFLVVAHRCDLLQGYLFSRPLPLSDFEAWCRGNLRS